MLHSHHDASLKITVHSADHLEDVEHFGKNDPYARFSFDFKNDKSFQKTSVKKNAGKAAVWNETVTLEHLKPEYQELYVEVMDDEKTVDAPIGFCAIPLRQVLEAPGLIRTAYFDLYSTDGKQKGTISLTLAVAQAGQPMAAAEHISGRASIQGQSMIVAAHHLRVKGLKNKEKVADGTGLALAGMAAIGAKYLLDQHKDGKKAEEAAKKEAALGHH
ncbi:hypothetical protein BGZ83_003033 [Gryganskiella cystojenkinii]|nr:hypothetical protein BGZ83_003033 [Gryganskiella cystojenkinii]